MFTRKALPDAGEGATAPKRLKANLQDLFLANDISATRAVDIFQDVADCKIHEFRGLAKAGGKNSKNGNTHRDLLRKMRKGSRWPPVYEAPIRVYNNRTQALETVILPMSLPHELIYAMAQRTPLSVLSSRAGMCETTAQHMQSVCEKMQCPDLIGVGLWGDGVPSNWDKSHSLEVFALLSQVLAQSTSSYVFH